VCDPKLIEGKPEEYLTKIEESPDRVLIGARTEVRLYQKFHIF